MLKKLTTLAMAAFLFAALIPVTSVVIPSEAYASSYNKPPPIKKDIPKTKPAQKAIKKDAIKKGGVSGIKLNNSSKNRSKFKPNHTTKNKSSAISLKKESSRRLELLRGKSDTKNLNVPKGVLSGANKAKIDPRKLTEYALNPNHPDGGNKAKVFESALGFNKSNADDLLKQLQNGVMNNPAVAGKVDQYGSRFTVDIPVSGPSGSGIVRTGWIYKTGSSTPEMTTLFVK